jgi:thiol-disulfide isomerase/thioredoxin
MKTIRTVLMLSALAMYAGFAAEENEVTLKVGDKAPALAVGKWVQGDPVEEFESGKAYIVEFWATWCGPCRVSIPHLNEIHEKFKGKGLIVIGQDCLENKEAEVVKFVKKMGDDMTYRVALDNFTGTKKGKMAETWMDAAGQRGIPSAFLVDKNSRIAWIGHPMGLKETVIEKVLDGSFDIAKAAKEYAERQKVEAQMGELQREFSKSQRNKDWDAAEAALKKMETLNTGDENESLNLAGARLTVKFGKKDYESAYKLARELSDAHKDNAAVQNYLAWMIATDPGIEQRDLDLAEMIANRANNASNGKDAAILDTVARVLFMKDKKEEAIRMQQKAVDLADGSAKKGLQKTLDSYKAGKLPSDE